MDLIRKVRTLLGALAHKPFTRSAARAPAEGQGPPGDPPATGGLAQTETAHSPAVETERVADLIARREQENG